LNCLPAYIDSELWEEFWAMRKKMGSRAPVTEFAKKLVLKELMKFHQEGYDPNNSLENSIMKGWRGVFQGQLRSESKTAIDPALKKIAEDSKKAAPIPANLREQFSKITGRV